MNNLSSRYVVLIGVVGVLLIIGGIIIGQATPLIFPAQASAESLQIDNLFHILLVVGGAIFLLVQGMLVFSIWRFRAKPNDTSDGIYLHGSTSLEIIWTAIPAVIVFVLTVLSWQVWNTLQTPRENEMEVVVDGRRFNWAFSYVSDVPSPNDASTPLVIKTTELHTYVGRPVVLKMNTQDVIHSFWVPAFRIKQDLIPGRETTVRFTPVEVAGAEYPVTYPIKCAELCGSNHGMMIANVIVHKDEASYKAWYDGELDKLLNPPADPVVRGRELLASNVYPCYTCHVESDLGWVGNVGPSLNGIGDRAVNRASAAGVADAREYLYQSIHEPGAYLVPGYGNLMPNLQIPECEALAIVAYLCTQSESGSPTCTIDEFAAKCAAGSTPAPAAEATAEAAAPAAEATTEAAAPAAEATTEAAPAAEATAEATASS